MDREIYYPRQNGSSIFEIWGDNNKLFESKVVYGHSYGGETIPINISVTDISTLKLKVLDTGDGNMYYDHADWADAKFVLKFGELPCNINIVDQTYDADTYGMVILARKNIYAGPSVQVLSTGNINFWAGNKIVLKPGFESRRGSKFNAYINEALLDPCCF